MASLSYEAFLKAKTHLPDREGLDVSASKMSGMLFPFQRDVVRWALSQGRAGIYAECGLGKGFMALEWARHVVEKEGKSVIVLAPLAVARQFLREAAKFGEPAVYAKSQSEVPASPSVVVTNYERLEAFDAKSFVGVVCDESSILKAYMGATKRLIIESFLHTKYKLACSATPAPNDHLEIGNQSDFLGILPCNEMIARWFINDTSTFGTYRLKGHAVRPFWQWVSWWARCFEKPSDLGDYSDEGYVLPALDLKKLVVPVDLTQGRDGSLWRTPELSSIALHKEKRITLSARVNAIAEVVNDQRTENWVVWCDTDYEADALMDSIEGAVEVRGSHPLEKKEKNLIAFTEGDVRVLVTKPRVAGFGLNWQHCARTAFVGASYSYEAFYQAIRRMWRFGQSRPVEAYIAMAQTELPVWAVLERKKGQHEHMKTAMFSAMRRGVRTAAEQGQSYQPAFIGQLPQWFTEQVES